MNVWRQNRAVIGTLDQLVGKHRSPTAKIAKNATFIAKNIA
jgi:hypothetical protein